MARISAGAVVAILVVGTGAWKLRGDRAERQAIARMTAGNCSFDRRSDPGAVNEHGANPSFKVDPPSGGVHDSSPARPGVYALDSRPGEGRVVHALEHGDIALWYRSDLPTDQLDSLLEVADRAPDDVLVAPRPNLAEAVVAVAWHKRLLCAAPDVEAVRAFTERYADAGPENQPD